MIGYEEFAYWAKWIHYSIAFGLMLFILLYGFRSKEHGIKTVIVRFYIAFFSWVLLVYLLDGCPLTHLENFMSLRVLGEELYPNYRFEDSDAFLYLRIPKFYIPLLILFVINGFELLSKNINNT